MSLTFQGAVSSKPQAVDYSVYFKAFFVLLTLTRSTVLKECLKSSRFLQQLFHISSSGPHLALEKF